MEINKKKTYIEPLSLILNKINKTISLMQERNDKVSHLQHKFGDFVEFRQKLLTSQDKWFVLEEELDYKSDFLNDVPQIITSYKNLYDNLSYEELLEAFDVKVK